MYNVHCTMYVVEDLIFLYFAFLLWSNIGTNISVDATLRYSNYALTHTQ